MFIDIMTHGLFTLVGLLFLYTFGTIFDSSSILKGIVKFIGALFILFGVIYAVGLFTMFIIGLFGG